MKRKVTIAIIGALMVIGMANSYGQTNTNIVAATFEVVQNVNFALTAMIQTTANNGQEQISKVAINNKTIINELGLATGTNLSGGILVAVTPNAVVVTDTNATNVASTTTFFQVRDKSGDVLADVTGFFSVGEVSQEIITTAKNGSTNTINSIDSFALTGTPNVTFTIQGLTTQTLTALVQNGTTIGTASQLSAKSLAGSGTASVAGVTAPALYTGSITINGKKVEAATLP